MNRYITVRCPVCRSVSQIKADGVRSEFFYCPVCEEGEIECHPESFRAFRDSSRLSLEWPELVPVYSTVR
jgi:hypothetical protein